MSPVSENVMNIRIRFLAALLLIALSTTAAVAPAAAGLAGIRARIDRVVALLQAPGPIHRARRRAILAEGEAAFAWREMARAAMGPRWRERTPAERAEFTRLFRTLVEDSYLSRVLRHQGEKVVYGRAAVDGDTALLPTQVVRPDGRPISVDYELLRRGDRWLVIDVLVEHIGLVSNYRSQFAAILDRSSYRQLIGKIQARIAALA